LEAAYSTSPGASEADGSVEENESPEEDEEGDAKVDRPKSEVADLKATPRDRNKEGGALCAPIT